MCSLTEYRFFYFNSMNQFFHTLTDYFSLKVISFIFKIQLTFYLLTSFAHFLFEYL